MDIISKHKNGSSDITSTDIKNEIEALEAKLHEPKKPKPKPLDSPTVPKFPVNAFPKDVRFIINEFHKSTKLPIDYYGLGILTVCASAIGSGFLLKIKEGYNIAPIFYSAIVGPSSIGKTPVLKACMGPAYEIEKGYRETYKSGLEQWEIEDRDSKEKTPKPCCKEFIIGDATIEAISQSLKNNSKGLLLFLDELVAWIKSMNQYRKGSDLEFWLSNFSNGTAKINRVSRDSIYIEKCFVGVLGGMQPAVLDNFGSNDKKDVGYLQRLLFAYPDIQTKPYPTDYVPDPRTFQMYRDLVINLHTHNEQATSSEPIKIELSKEAKQVFRGFQNYNVDLINDSDNESVKSLHGKLEDYCLRIALVLEMMKVVLKGGRMSESTKVQPETIKSAILLTEYFRATGLKVLAKIEKVNPLDGHTTIQQKVYEALPETFTTGQGVIVAGECKMKERSFKRFLQDKLLFDKIARGHYDKKL